MGEVEESGEMNISERRVGIIYDEKMCKHHTPDGDYHPENPNRIRVIWNKLLANNIPQRYSLYNFFFWLNSIDGL